MDIWITSTIVLFIVIVSKILAKRTKTVDILWLIIIGALSSNMHIIDTHNSEFFEILGEWGIIFIMFALGFDEDISHFHQALKKSLGIAIIGAIFPFLAGYLSAIYFGSSSNSAILWGLTMTATAVSLTMVSLKSENMHKSTASSAIMTAAVIDDILSLVGVAIILPLIFVSDVGESGLNIATILIIIVKVTIFFLLIIFLGLFAFPEERPKINDSKKPQWVKDLNELLHRHFVDRVNIKKLLLTSNGEFTPLVMLFIAMSVGSLSYLFGFHPAIGAYMAGLFLKEEYFIFKHEQSVKNYYQESKTMIDTIAFVIFGPIFFINLGAKIEFDMAIFIDVLPQFLTLFTLVFIFQILSAMFAARYTGDYKWHESVMIGLGMLGRAELAFIVIEIAYSDHHIFTINEFYTMIFTIFLLNISVPLTIKFWKPYYLGEKHLELFGTKISR